jgi:hypothetical protein
VKGTIFNEFHDEDRIMKVINFSEFEEMFKLGPKQGSQMTRENSVATNANNKRFKAPEKVTMLENNRLRNMAISLKKLNTPTDIVIKTLNSFDVDALTVEQMEILLRMIPTAAEIQVYKEYMASGKSVDEMTDEDKFLCAISKIERLEQKAKILHYMSTIACPVVAQQTIVQVCRSRIATLTEASRSLLKSPGIRAVLEYILVFGNYMNSSTRTMASGPAYGFKLQTLDLITETKSSQDRTKSLLHYVVDVIGKNYKSQSQDPSSPDSQPVSPTSVGKKSEAITIENTRLPFDLDKLHSLLERAALLSMETVASEVMELDRGMEMAKKELANRQSAHRTREGEATTTRLQNFINSRGPEVQALRDDLKRAQSDYNECVEYFGENPKLLESSSYLFGAFSKFMKQYRQALYENRLADRKKMEAMIQERIAAANAGNGSENGGGSGSGDAGEEKTQPKVREKRLIGQDDLYNGAFEDILLELKSAPYRRADAVRRSQRRKNGDLARLSGTDMDL